ncbi:MAG: ribbon-helix-helix domain-containing protein [Ktedonobacteraceae bacterium]|jgi:hypothetical protein
MPQRRTNLYLTQEQLKKLRERSEREKLPIAEIVRRAVDAYLAWDDPTYRRTETRNGHSSPA